MRSGRWRDSSYGFVGSRGGVRTRGSGTRRAPARPRGRAVRGNGVPRRRAVRGSCSRRGGSRATGKAGRGRLRSGVRRGTRTRARGRAGACPPPRLSWTRAFELRPLSAGFLLPLGCHHHGGVQGTFPNTGAGEGSLLNYRVALIQGKLRRQNAGSTERSPSFEPGVFLPIGEALRVSKLPAADGSLPSPGAGRDLGRPG